MNKSLVDCVFFLKTGCTKGTSCEFRHCEATKETSNNCKKWLQSLNGCTNMECKFRHPTLPLKPDGTRMPCYYLISTGNCARGDNCFYAHYLPHEEKGTPQSEEKEKEKEEEKPQIKKMHQNIGRKRKEIVTKRYADQQELQKKRAINQQYRISKNSIAPVHKIRDKGDIPSLLTKRTQKRAPILGLAPKPTKKKVGFGIKSLTQLRAEREEGQKLKKESPINADKKIKTNVTQSSLQEEHNPMINIDKTVTDKITSTIPQKEKKVEKENKPSELEIDLEDLGDPDDDDDDDDDLDEDEIDILLDE